MNRLSVFTLVALLSLQSQMILSQPLGDGVISDLDVTSLEACEREHIEVFFTIPARYISRFPLAQGDQLRIQIRPLMVDSFDDPELTERETRVFDREQSHLLREIIYEGDQPSGPSITLEFYETTQFDVFQGSDYRSISIIASPIAVNSDPSCQNLPTYSR